MADEIASLTVNDDAADIGPTEEANLMVKSNGKQQFVFQLYVLPWKFGIFRVLTHRHLNCFQRNYWNHPARSPEKTLPRKNVR